MRDFPYQHETMPSETDAEFIAMVKVATINGHWLSTWMRRLIEIAERAVKKEAV